MRALAPLPLRTCTRTRMLEWALNVRRCMCLYSCAYVYSRGHRDAHLAVARLNCERAPARTHACTHTHTHTRALKRGADACTRTCTHTHMHTYKHTYIYEHSDTHSGRPLPLLARARAPPMHAEMHSTRARIHVYMRARVHILIYMCTVIPR